MSSRRIARLNEQMKREISEILRREVQDPRVGMPTVTGVAVTPDLYVANDYGMNRFYRNEGDGSFKEVAEELGLLDRGNGMGVSWGDLNNDGLLDVYVANMSSTAGNRILDRLKDDVDEEVYEMLKKTAAGNTIFLRSGEGFEALPAEAGGVNASWAWSPMLCDFDLDGRTDIFVTNGFVTGDLAHDT